MPHNRMLAYLLLAGWIGALSGVGWWNVTDGRWFAVGVNAALIAVDGAVLVAMGRADYRRGRIVDDRPASPRRRSAEGL